MFKSLYTTAVIAALSLPTAVAAEFLIPRESFVLPVNPVDADSFEVIEADGAGSAQIWCAAGLYTRRVLGQDSGDLYLEVARGASETVPGRKAVTFTTTPVPGAFQALLTSTRRVGLTNSVAMANALCQEARKVAVRVGPNRVLRN